MYKSLSQNEWESVRLVTSKKYTSKEYFFKTDLTLQNFNKLFFIFYNLYTILQYIFSESDNKYSSSCDLAGLF